jgi:hypothetical protein
VLSAVLVAAALLAGVTGAWSPCGFSMVETLAPTGFAQRLRTTILSCATFTLGALAGGVATFGGLALLGQALGAGSGTAVAVAAAIAVAAAACEARGVRIVCQIRRQVPEAWRRVLPVPLAAALYGVLLGLGFTTFVLSYAVWALAALAVALGDPALGALVGVAFGAGRALPVVALAPAAGGALHAAMAERPAIYRALRAGDAVALAACAAVLAGAPAQAATIAARNASDPSAAPGALAFQRPGATGVLHDAAGERILPGREPVLAGGQLAWRQGEQVAFADPASLAPLGAEPVPGATSFAFSAAWILWRAPGPAGGEVLLARPRGNPAAAVRTLASVPEDAQIGRPVVDGERAVFPIAGASGARIIDADLATGVVRRLRAEPRALLTGPALLGGELLYVRSTASRQELRIGPATPGRPAGDAVLYSTLPTARRDAGREAGQGRHRHYGPNGSFIPALPARPPAGVVRTLWSAALAADAAYVTRLERRRGGPTTATILRVPRP